MSFDRDSLERHVAGGPVARVVVAATKGSVPREAGAAMLVTADETFGTIGGGALEFEAIDRARAALEDGRDRLDKRPLGPDLGQCCGGAVTLLTEIWDARRLAETDETIVARPLPGGSPQVPLAVRRLVSAARRGEEVAPGLVSGWMVEPVTRPKREVWVWGAGHVGRALVGVLAPLPDLKLFWADSDKGRFPEVVPERIEVMVAANPADLVPLSDLSADHIVLTYSHALDLEICHRVLSRPFGTLGLIGSATKRARFRSRLAALGHGPDAIARLVCPIGDPSLGKHPQAIAVGVAAALLVPAARAGTETRVAR